MSMRSDVLERVPAQRMASGFAKVLDSFRFESLETISDPAFALTADLRLSYVNPAYVCFGSENGGQQIDSFVGIGTYIGDVLVGPLRDFYLAAYQRVLEEGERWDHEYECSSPTLFRRYLQSVYPLEGGAGLVAVNHLLVEDVHTLKAEDPDRDRYVNSKGLIVQCSHCRCVQRQGMEHQWDWVPDWVVHCPKETTHSLCSTCFTYYYGFLQPIIDEKKKRNRELSSGCT